MTYKEKLESSEIIESERIHYKVLNLLNNKQRFRAIIFVLLIAIYTIYTKIVLKNFSFDILIISNIVGIVTMIYIKSTSHSLYALNHHKMYSYMLFFNKLSKLVIFIFSALMYYESINNALINYYDMTFVELIYYFMLYIGSSDSTFLNIIADFYYKYEFIHLVSFVISIILFIPSFFYFLFFVIKSYFSIFALTIPFVNIIVILRWLFKDNTIFYEYTKENDTFYIKNKRKFKCFGYNLLFFLLKLVLIAIIVGVIFLIIYVVSNYNF